MLQKVQMLASIPLARNKGKVYGWPHRLLALAQDDQQYQKLYCGDDIAQYAFSIAWCGVSVCVWSWWCGV